MDNTSGDKLDLKITEKMSNIKHKIAIISGKGGVGKTTVAVNLARILASKKLKTGILDADIHGPNVPKMLGIEAETIYGDEAGMHPVKINPYLYAVSLALMLEKDTPIIWRGPLKIGAIKQFIGEVEWGELDFLIVDLPPGTGDEPLSIGQNIKDGHAVIVTTPQDVALLDSRRSIRFAQQLNMNVLGLVENMSGFTCPHCGKDTELFKVGGGKRAATEMGIPFLGSIPIDKDIVLSGDSGVSTFNDNAKISEAFVHIVDAIVNSVK